MTERFPSIGSYGFLSDCHTSALVTHTGEVEWMCLPRFDSPSVFGALLDRSAGSFRLAPTGVTSPISRRYEPGTLIVETTWFTETGWAVARDALTIPEASESRTRDLAGDRTPRSGHRADACLLRHVTCIDGEVELEMRCEPKPVYGLGSARWSTAGAGECIASMEARALDGGPHMAAGPSRLHLTCDMALDLQDGCASARGTLRSGDEAFCALSWDDSAGSEIPRSQREARSRLESTRRFWRAWLRHGSFPDHPWRVHLQRSALVLKGLTYAPTGAIVAAPTTSLPEAPGGERNWDYRYSWIRDSTFALWAMHSLGFSEEATDYMRFIDEVSRSRDLQIMYGIGGETGLDEHTLSHLSGYEGARPVRIGNGAYNQRQNDVWGALMDSIYLHTKARGNLDEGLWEIVERQVEAAIAAWPRPDQGMWEARGRPRHYVSSKLMIWVAVERGARLAEKRAGDDAGQASELVQTARHWRATASEIKQEICERGVRDGVFRQHYETDALDASTLLIPLVRFLPPDDHRVRETVLTVARKLHRDGFVLRYRTEETDDGLSGDEGAFLTCSFWLVSALSEIGERGWARALCERLLTASGWLDLYAEELDVMSGRHLGNFPQALTHLALVNAVSHVIADEGRLRNVDKTAVFSEIRGATIGT